MGISTNASVHRDELTQFMGDEISRIIQEQRDLEKKYEELIAQRGQLKGLCNKAKFTEVQREIQDVAHRLKESNKSLCRNLKENPNVQGNLMKMQSERSLVVEWFEETKTELMDMSFNDLVTKVDAERRDQERLNEMRKKEREVSQTVRLLDADVQREYADHEKETKLANQEIKEIKEDLQKHKMISEIEFKFEEKKLRAREQALLRIHAQMERALREELEALEGANELERTVHGRAHEFLEHKLNNLQDMKQKWDNDFIKETEDRNRELENLKEKRTAAYSELTELEDKRQAEALEHKAKEDDMRNAVIIEKQRREQLQRMADSVLFLQSEGRAYIERILARKAAAKGKKGKKGKKK